MLVSSLSISWKFNFHHNLLEQEIKELAPVMFVLVHVYL